MTSEEIQAQIDELETRVDRLRALYEQYFTGIERLEPLVQKKDVERRFHALRKIQIRNTGLRFRFQMLVQKYTVYLTYWQRICRQIEEGTFKRDLLRAQRYGSAEARRPSADEEQVYELDPDAIEVLPDTGESEDEPTGPQPDPFAPPASVPVYQARGIVEELPPGLFGGSPSVPPPPAPARPAVPVPAPVAAKPAAAAPVPVPAPKLPLPAAAAVAAPKPPAPASAAPAAKPALPATPPAMTAPAMPSPSPGRPAVPAPPPPAAQAGSASPQSAPRRPLISPFAAPRAAPPAQPTAPAKLAAPTQPGASIARPAQPVAPAAPAPAATKPAGAAPRPTALMAQDSVSAGVDESAIRALYERYRDARKRNGEADVSFDQVARQVRETIPRLAEKYRDHEITLDVGLKDGKTVLRPVVRPRKG